MSTLTANTSPIVLDKARLFAEIEYEPHQGQRLVHASNARFKVVCCGRRWGKSSFAGHEITYHLMNPADKNNVYWIVGPTYELGEREFEVVYNDIIKLPISRSCKIAYNKQQGNMSIQMPPPPLGNGALCEVKSAERPRGLQGKGLSGVIMSESAEHDQNTWSQFIRPALSDKRGWATFPSTPKGFNYFYEFYNLGTDGNAFEWDSWRFPSWTNDKIFSGRDDPEIISMERELSAMKFAQEVCAEFTTFEGRVYQEFDNRIHVREMDVNTYISRLRNYWSFDFGYTNPTCCLDIMVDEMDNVYVWREYYERFRSYSEHGKALLARHNPPGFHVDSRFGDPADPGGMAELANLIGTIFPAKAEWASGVEAVKSHLTVRRDTATGKYRPKLFISPQCPILIQQLNQLPVATNRQGIQDPKEGQKKKDDHAADALRYFFTGYFVLGMGRSFTPVAEAMNSAMTMVGTSEEALGIPNSNRTASSGFAELLGAMGGSDTAGHASDGEGFFKLDGMRF